MPKVEVDIVSVVDQIMVDEQGNINVRTVTRYVKDGALLNQTYHRHVVARGKPTDQEDQRVRAIANAVWALL